MRANVESQFRSLGLFVALVAVTFNFLQPLVHAAAMRDGSASVLWSAFCKSAAAGEARSNGVPAPAGSDQHECCLGLAHAAAAIDPPATFVLAPVAAVARSLPVVGQPSPGGIRDGPSQPRGPPFIA